MATRMTRDMYNRCKAAVEVPEGFQDSSGAYRTGYMVGIMGKRPARHPTGKVLAYAQGYDDGVVARQSGGLQRLWQAACDARDDEMQERYAKRAAVVEQPEQPRPAHVDATPTIPPGTLKIVKE